MAVYDACMEVHTGGGHGGVGGSTLLAPLSLRVRAAGLVYEDTVEWDVFGGGQDAGGIGVGAPEAFAMRTVADLGLPPEFEPAIALALREQVWAYREVSVYVRA